MSQYTATIDLATLDGTNGFRIDGLANNDRLGRSVSVGDINGDGLADIVVGAPYVPTPGGGNSGAVYVLIGQPGGFGGAAAFDVTTLNGANGFKLSGLNAGDYTGYSVSAAGDINGDGFDDLVIGAEHYGTGGTNVGRTYVVFGKAGGFSSGFDLASLDGTNGFRFEGAGGQDALGRSVAAAGDINGDGADDLIVGAPSAAATNGRAYVVFGHAGAFASDFDLSTLDGTNGFAITGAAAFDTAGMSVGSAGDINGDGLSDLLIGAILAGNGTTSTGAGYVIFGKASGFAANIDLGALDGTNGFKISTLGGGTSTLLTGMSVASAGDVNGDGFADFVVGASHDLTAGQYAGAAYVVFGKAGGFGAQVDLGTLNGTNGFKITAANAFDNLGDALAYGDVNGDGFSDVIVGAYGANAYAGAVHVIFGKASGFAANIDVDTLDGTNGFTIPGLTPSDDVGASIASADLNGDGVSDLIIGASHADSTPGDNNGATYVVYGHLADAPVNLTGTSASQSLAGSPFDDTLSGLDGNDTLYGNGGNDTLDGGNGTDIAAYGAATSGVTVDLSIAGAQAIGGGMGSDTLISIEGVRGSNFDDLLKGDAGVNAFYGGAGNDGIYFGPNYTTADHVDGGAGANDQIGLEGDYSAGFALTSASIVNVEVMALLPGFNYVINVSDDFLSAGQGFTFWSVSMGPANHVQISCDFETDGHYTFFLGQGDDIVAGGSGDDLFYGEGGSDNLTGEGGVDTFAYLAVSDSTGPGFDRIGDFQPGLDKFKLPVSVTAVDAIVPTGALSLGTFDSDLATAVDATTLGAHHAVEFSATSGGLSGNTFLVIDANGVAGYQAGQDFVMQISGQLALSTTDFI